MPAMRRIFLIFLLVLLPLQFTWAAGASYCQHEQEKVSKHLGHHVHQHDGQADTGGEQSQKSQPDNDCCICHLAATSAVPLSAPPIILCDNPHPPDTYAVTFHSYIPDGLSKPNWRPAI